MKSIKKQKVLKSTKVTEGGTSTSASYKNIKKSKVSEPIANTLKRSRIINSKLTEQSSFEDIEKKIFRNVTSSNTEKLNAKGFTKYISNNKLNESGSSKSTPKNMSYKKDNNLDRPSSACNLSSVNCEDEPKIKYIKKSVALNLTKLADNVNSKSKKCDKIPNNKAPISSEKSKGEKKYGILLSKYENTEGLKKNKKIYQTSESSQNKLCKSVENIGLPVLGKKNAKNIKKNQINRNGPRKNSNRCKKKNLASSSDSNNSDWENVDELHELFTENVSLKNTENVQIELKHEDALWGYKKRKRKSENEIIEDYLRKQVNRSTKEVYEWMHKTHLLCLFAHGIFVNNLLTSQCLLASSMSIIPKEYFSPKRFDLSHLEKFVKWFCRNIAIEENKIEKNYFDIPLEETLAKRLSSKSVCSRKELVLLFILITRSIGMDVRLVFSFYPISWKPSIECLIRPRKDEFSETIKEVEEPSTSKNINTLEKNLFSRKMISSSSELDEENSLNKRNMHKKKKLTKLSDDEFESKNDNLKIPRKISKSKSLQEKRKSLCDDANSKKKKKEILGEWAEVYVEEEEKWISVDVTKCKIHCTSDIEARSPSSLAYVIAYNVDHTVKDVTRRYVSSWLSYKDKIQCDGEWWGKTLKPFLGWKSRKNNAEDKELDENLRMQPLPKTLGEYKNHPLYALQRHLLKFEAIFPPNPSPVGFFRGEPVYPRDCIKTLSGREYWIREAKVVRVGEEPYKVVKARPKWDKALCQVIKDRPLELFGEWQVEDYEPPIAKNGKVPRNEYGNVELFKPSMLPKGCVHLPISGLARTARKLDIDCAPALVGFEFHKGACHPLNDGFVICEEFKDILLDAWNEEQIELEKREKEKRIKRIFGNWKRVIHGAMLKERIRETYKSTGKLEEMIEADKKIKIQEAKKVENKKKIDQMNLFEPMSNLVTHQVPNLKIDFGSCITISKKKKRPKKCNFKVKDKIDDAKERMTSSDSDKSIDSPEKQDKIRKLLQWNPVAGGRSDPELSDNSEESDDGSLLPCAGVSNIKQLSAKKCHLNLKTKHSEKESLTSSSDEDECPQLSPPKALITSAKRRSLRPRNKVMKVSYTESGKESDISLDDSDTGDKAFDPSKEKQ